MIHAGQCDRIRFAKDGGDLGPPAGLPHLRIHLPAMLRIALQAGKYCATHGAPAFAPSLPCFSEVRSADTRIRHTVACHPNAFVRRGRSRPRLTRHAKTCMFMGQSRTFDVGRSMLDVRCLLWLWAIVPTWPSPPLRLHRQRPRACGARCGRPQYSRRARAHPVFG